MVVEPPVRLLGGLVELAEHRAEKVRAVLDRGEAQIGEPIEDLLEDGLDQPVLRRALDGEPLERRAGTAAARKRREGVVGVTLRRVAGVRRVDHERHARFVDASPHRVEHRIEG